MASRHRPKLEHCPRPDDMLDYWPELIEGMRFSTKEFYDRTEAALQARQIPELEVSRVDIKEGGPMTPRREYLRLRRERLVFDICAMPFGSGFYVSEWFWKQPRQMALVVILVLMGMVGLGYAAWTETPLWIFRPIYEFLYSTFGIGWLSLRTLLAIAVPLMGLLIAFLIGAMWFGEAMDCMLMRIPLIGHVYERVLRRVTYYREDRTHAFQAAAHAALCSVIDDICNTQGIAPLSDAAKRPMHPQVNPRVGPLRRKTQTQPVG